MAFRRDYTVHRHVTRFGVFIDVQSVLLLFSAAVFFFRNAERVSGGGSF